MVRQDILAPCGYVRISTLFYPPNIFYTDYFGILADQKKQTTLGFGGGAGLKYFFKNDGPVGLDVAVRYDQNTFKYGYITNGVGTLAGAVGLFYRWW